MATDHNFKVNNGLTVKSGGITNTGDSVLTGTSGSGGNAFTVNRGSTGSQAIRVQNTGEVVISSNYLYASSSGISLYVQNGSVFRGTITNDGGNTLSISSGSANISFNSKNFTNVGTINSGAITATTVNTGQGNNELYDMNQNVKTTDSPTFDELTVTDFVKASGNNIKFSAGGTHVLNIDLNRKIYAQTHNSTDIGFSTSNAFKNAYFAGTGNFGTINTGQGSTEVYLMNQNVRSSDSPTFQDLTIQGNLAITGDINSYNVTDLDVVDKTITLGVGGTASANNGGGIIVDGANAKLTWSDSASRWTMNKSLQFSGTTTTTNQAMGVFWPGFDKEATSDYSDNASIIHTINTGGHTGSVLLFSSQNDANDGIAFITNGSSSLKHNSSNILTAANFASNITSVSNADTVDSLHAASFLRSDATDTATGGLTLSNSGNHYNGHHYFDAHDANGNHYPHYEDGSSQNGSQVSIRLRNASQGFDVLYLDSDSNNITWRGNKVWNAGNDGGGSGLDADTVDGIQGASFLRSDAADTATGTITFSGGINVGDLGSGGITGSNYNITGVNQLSMNDPGEGINFAGSAGVTLYAIDDSTDSIMNFANATELRVNNSKVWTTSNDGGGSGLDADTVDGIQSSSFLRSDANDSYSGVLSLTGELTLSSSSTRIDGSDGHPLVQVNSSRAYFGSTNRAVTTLATNSTTGLKANVSGTDYTVWHAGNDGSGSGLDADLLDNQQGSYYTNASNLSSGYIPSARLATGASGDWWSGNAVKVGTDGVSEVGKYIDFHNTDAGTSDFDTRLESTGSSQLSINGSGRLFTDGYHPNADTWTTARTITLGGDLTGNVSINGSANVTLTAAVVNDSHTHAFNNLTGKTSATGEYSTSGYLTAGRGSGGVSLTHNDGYGNANVTFNHKAGVPEQNGNSARIEVNTDSNAGDTQIIFGVNSSVTSGVAIQPVNAVVIRQESVDIRGTLRHAGNTGTYLKFDTDRVRLVAGGTTKFDSNNTYLTSHQSLSGYATESYVGTQISNLVDSSPSALNTLNELAAALGDDANFSTTVNANIATKLPKAGGTMTGALAINSGGNAITISSTSPQIRFNDTDHDDFWIHVNSDRFYILADRDGSGSWETPYPLELNASTNIGYIFSHRAFTEAYHPNADAWTTARTITLGGDLTGNVSINGSSNVTLTAAVVNDSHTHDGRYFTESETNSLLAARTELNHFRSLGTPAFTGTATTAGYISEMESDGAFDSYSSAFKTTWSYAGNFNISDGGTFGPTETAGMAHLTWTDNSSDSARGNITVLAIAPTTGGSAGGVYVYNDQGSSYAPGWREIWTSSTDGAGSGLDADKLDAQEGSYYLDYNNFSNIPTNRVLKDSLTANSTSNLTTFQSNSNMATASGGQSGIQIYRSGSGSDAFMTFHVGGDFACYFGLDGGTNKLSVGGWSMGANSYEIYHSGNKPSLATLGYTGATDANNYSFPYTISTSASNNTVVRRNGNGYIFGSYLNMTGTFANAPSGGTMSYFTGTNGSDNYGRSWTPAQARTALNVADGANNYVLPTALTATTFTTSGNVVIGGDGFFNGSKLEGDSKEMIRYNDAWLRLNPANEFTSGIYCGTGKLRTDGQLEVGGNGSAFKVTTAGVVTVAGSMSAASYSTLANTTATFNGYNGVPMVQGVNGAAYYHGSDNGGYGIVIQGGHPICKSVKIGAVNAGTTVIDASRNLINIADSTVAGTATFNSDIYGKSVNNAHSALYRFGGIYFTWDSDSYGTNTQHSIRSTDGDTYGDHITLNSFGNVRINFDSNSNGTNYFRIGHATTGTGNVLLTMDEAGNGTFAGNVTAYSDERLKENIVNVDNALDKVCSMRGVYYNMIADETKSRRLGLVAQEVEKVLPEVVIEAKPEDDKDSILSVDYGNVVGLLIEAIKEQQETINKLTSRIDDIEKGE